MKWKVLDLFAGCGGLSEGLRSTGDFTSVSAVESDLDAAETYALNFGDHVFADRIENVESFARSEIVVGGPPCQAFSPLNREGVGWERRSLWKQYLRAIDDSEPLVFVMENVPQLLDSAEFKSFHRAAMRRGYTVNFGILNVADFGVPQVRRRAFVLGSKFGKIPFPTATHSAPTSPVPGTLPWATFREAVVGLAAKPNGVNWHRARNPRPESIVRYKAVPKDGGNRFEMQAALDAAGNGELVPRCWRNKPKGTTDVFGRLWWDKPSVTIRTEFFKPEKGRYLHPVQDRSITLREGARCMSFDDNFRFPEHQSMTSVARQIGNAVPPLMAAALGRTISDHLRSAKSARTEPIALRA